MSSLVIITLLGATMPIVSSIWHGISLILCLVLYSRGRRDWLNTNAKLETYKKNEHNAERDTQQLVDELNETIDKQVSALRSVSGLNEHDVKILEKVQSATSQNRLELYLQPIIELDDGATKFYEAFSRLRDEEGALLRPADYLEAVERANHIGFIDNMILMRSVQAVRAFADISKKTTVFCNVSPATLYDQNFFALFTHYLDTNDDLSDQIVFEFTRPAISLVDPTIAKSLAVIADRGFAFSVDHVHRLDFDLNSLKRLNLSYVKASAHVILNAADDEKSGFNDFMEGLDKTDICLIAEKIEHREQQERLHALGIKFGQGNYCGNPQPASNYIQSDADDEPVAIKQAS